jgi:ribosome-interacting GTPase 1
MQMRRSGRGVAASDLPHLMPANLTPEYRAAEVAFRKARDPRDRLECLREMLRVMPKHKGTDHLQGDIRRRIKELSEELERPRRGGGHGGPALVIRPEGAAQIAVLGPPNAGKSSLHARLTGSDVAVAPYPFTTQHPEPGMMAHEGIHFQLIDVPAVSPEHPIPWLANTLQTADACLFVVALSDPACLEDVEAAHAVLRDLRISLSEAWPFGPGARTSAAEADEDPFALRLPTLLLANKADRLADPAAELQVFLELASLRYPALAVSAVTGAGLGEIGPWLFDHLGVVRVYTKAPGRPADRAHPFALRRGQTVEDVAQLVHKDLARTLRHARVWGHAGFQGQLVGRDHEVADGDVVELHT